MQSTWLTTAIVAAVTLASAGASQARDLAGTLHLDGGLKLVVELKEGFFSEVLRKIGLRSSPRPRVDLTELSSNGDRIFIGTDFNVYCEKLSDGGYKADQIFKIGNAIQLWSISLVRGVKLSEVQPALGQFVGETRSRLKVDLPEVPKKPADVEKAGMRFWLDEVVYQFDNPGRRKGKVDNFAVITRSLLAALPEHSDEPQALFDNFQVLALFIRETKDSNLVPFRDLLRQKIARIKERTSRGELAADKSAAVLKEYEGLQAQVDKRTEDL